MLLIPCPGLHGDGFQTVAFYSSWLRILVKLRNAHLISTEFLALGAALPVCDSRWQAACCRKSWCRPATGFALWPSVIHCDSSRVWFLSRKAEQRQVYIYIYKFHCLHKKWIVEAHAPRQGIQWAWCAHVALADVETSQAAHVEPRIVRRSNPDRARFHTLGGDGVSELPNERGGSERTRADSHMSEHVGACRLTLLLVQKVFRRVKRCHEQKPSYSCSWIPFRLGRCWACKRRACLKPITGCGPSRTRCPRTCRASPTRRPDARHRGFPNEPGVTWPPKTGQCDSWVDWWEGKKEQSHGIWIQGFILRTLFVLGHLLLEKPRRKRNTPTIERTDRCPTTSWAVWFWSRLLGWA